MQYFDLYDSNNVPVVRITIADLRLLEWGEQIELMDGEQISKFFNPDNSFLWAGVKGVIRCDLVGWSRQIGNSLYDLMTARGSTDERFYLSNGNSIRIYNLQPGSFTSLLTIDNTDYILPDDIDGEVSYYVLVVNHLKEIGQLWFKYSYHPDDPASYEDMKIDRVKASNLYSDLLTTWLAGANISSDPYSPGGISQEAGAGGDHDDHSDPVDIPDLPSLTSVDTGYITIYNPKLSELRDLARYMWSNPLFDVSAWKKIFADPMQAILGLSIVPVAVRDGGVGTVTVGNIPTDVEMTKALSQYEIVDCGSLNVNEFWGAYLDYDPYTKAEIYLPYIGTHALAVDDIMGKTISVVYHIDILSGACCAYVKCGDSVLYSFVGQCASSIPITGDNWTNVINGAISIAGSIGSMVASGGMSAPMAIGQIASTAVNTMKPSIEKSGSMGGTGGLLGIQTPYLILTRPRQALPKDQNVFKGYPSFITATMGDLSGYTEIDTVHLEDIPATDAEIVEIESILKTGVIF